MNNPNPLFSVNFQRFRHLSLLQSRTWLREPSTKIIKKLRQKSSPNFRENEFSRQTRLKFEIICGYYKNFYRSLSDNSPLQNGFGLFTLAYQSANFPKISKPCFFINPQAFRCYNTLRNPREAFFRGRTRYNFHQALHLLLFLQPPSFREGTLFQSFRGISGLFSQFLP